MEIDLKKASKVIIIITRFKTIRAPLSREEIQGSKRQRTVKIPPYNQVLWHKVLMERFNKSFNKTPEGKYLKIY